MAESDPGDQHQTEAKDVRSWQLEDANAGLHSRSGAVLALTSDLTCRKVLLRERTVHRKECVSAIVIKLFMAWELTYRLLQVVILLLEHDNPMGSLDSPNTAFTKLATLLAYLVMEINKTAKQACHLCLIPRSSLFTGIPSKT